jgi:hypothetical protein
MAEFFKLEGTLVDVKINSNQGVVKLNTLKDITGEWSGKYYTDYEINVTATPNEGYEFAGWKVEGAEILGNKNSQSVSIKLRDNCSIEAIFKNRGEN